MLQVRTALRTLLLLAPWALVPLAAAEQSVAPAFEARELFPGVHLLEPRADRADLSNSLVVEREDGLLVVEAQATEAAARELLAAVATLGTKPVRYLVLTHAHAESAGGAAAFPAATLVIGTVGTRDALRDPAFDFGAEARGRAPAWGAPSRRPPELVLHARTELEDPVNEVELLPLGHSHTAGDLLVFLPNQNVYFAGALTFPDGNPYGVGANVGGWLSTLNYLVKSGAALFIPLRGEPLDARGVRRSRDAFAWLRGQVELGFIEQVTPERIPGWVLESEDLASHFDTAASPSFLRGLIEQVVEEALQQRRKRGLL